MPERQLRRFTARGLQQARRLVEELRAGPEEVPPTLLDDPALTEPVEDHVVTPRAYEDRRDAGTAMRELLGPLEEAVDVPRDTGLWTWLALAHIDILAPEDESGRRPMKETARWVLEVDRHDRYYRHSLAGPYVIVRTHEEDLDDVDVLLCRTVEVPGDIVEQLSARQDYVRSRGVMAAATELYVDREKGGHKYRAATRRGAWPGNVLRFIDWLGQIEVTYHLPSMTKEQVLALLPDEFDDWR